MDPDLLVFREKLDISLREIRVRGRFSVWLRNESPLVGTCHLLQQREGEGEYTWFFGLVSTSHRCNIEGGTAVDQDGYMCSGVSIFSTKQQNRERVWENRTFEERAFEGNAQEKSQE